MTARPTGGAVREFERLASVEDLVAIEALDLQDRLDGLQSTYDVLARRAAQHPDDVVLSVQHGSVVGAEEHYTCARLHDEVVRVTAVLRGLGVARRDAVGYLLPNVVDSVIALLAGATAGIAVPINPQLAAESIADILGAGSAKVLLAAGPDLDPHLWRKALDVGARRPDLRIVPVDRCDEVDGLPTLSALMRAAPGPGGVDSASITPADVAAYFHTGGTTGAPKLVAHTQGNQLANAVMCGIAFDLRPDDVVLITLPLFHVAAAIMSFLAPLMAGARMVLLAPKGLANRGVVDGFWPIVEHFRATIISFVPTLASRLLEVPVGSADVTSLRYASCGTAPLPISTLRAFQAATGVAILEGYGLTETTASSAVNPRNGRAKTGSIGIRLPYQAMKTVILDADGRHVRDCAADEVGQIVIRGPNVTPGYLNGDPAELFLDGGWLRTGDIGRQDADGYFWLSGRAKDIIIRGGHNIAAADVEATLASHDSVASVAAVGRPDPEFGEVPIVFVTLRPGTQVDPATLLAYAGRHASEPVCAPSEVLIESSLPLTAVGKIYKPDLRARATGIALLRALRAALDAQGFHRIPVEVSVATEAGSARATIQVGAGLPGLDTGQDQEVRDAVTAALAPFAVAWTFADALPPGWQTPPRGI
ncbi:AMP-binding protein [uncultured Jatrophihabitans sp.]|uniref:AMP-binding protein n=1 Tax=uncultured Jatrophihabitans sp. TaxID=1610747 RepID=UPI0035CA4329